jgi:hypothetical protein
LKDTDLTFFEKSFNLQRSKTEKNLDVMDCLQAQRWPRDGNDPFTIPLFFLSADVLKGCHEPVHMELSEHQACFVSQIADKLENEVHIKIQGNLAPELGGHVIAIEFHQKYHHKGSSWFIAYLGQASTLDAKDTGTLLQQLLSALDYLFVYRDASEYHIQVHAPEIRGFDERLLSILSAFRKTGISFGEPTMYTAISDLEFQF